MCQEHIRKGRKSVSFADNKEVKYYKPDEIEVMEKESNQGNELDQQQEGFDQKNLMEKNSWDISSMETLLHAPIETLGKPLEVDDGTDQVDLQKSINDKTIIFSGDDGMDMTRSHTVAIDIGLTEQNVLEKPTSERKIDFSSFLLHFKTKNQTESCTAEKLGKFSFFPSLEPTGYGTVGREEKEVHCERTSTNSTDQSGVWLPFQQKPPSPPKKKKNFQEFLASLNLPSQPKDPQMEGVENICAFPSFKDNQKQVRENSTTFFREKPHACSLFQDNYNVTQLFRKQDNAMEVTQCCTSNIGTFFPSGGAKGDTVMCGDENMELTVKNTTEISTSKTSPNKAENCENSASTWFQSSKLLSERPVLSDVQDDMEMIKSHTVAIDSQVLGSTVNQKLECTQKSRCSPIDSSSMDPVNKTVLCSDDKEIMDITRSNTAVIFQNFERQSTIGSNLLLLNEKTVVFSSGDNMDLTERDTVTIDSRGLGRARNSLDLRSCGKKVSSSQLASTLLSCDGTVGIGHSFGRFNSGEVDSCNKLKQNALTTLPLSSDKTVVFELEQDEMEITRSHTVAIEHKNLELAVNQGLKSVGKSRQSIHGLTFSQSDKTVVFSGKDDDMDLTRSHTIAIENKYLGLPESQKQDDSKSTKTQSLVQFHNEKLAGFSNLSDDIDMTKNQTVTIGSTRQIKLQTLLPVGQKTGKLSVIGVTMPSSSIDQSIISGDDMDITRSHGLVIGSEKNLQNSPDGQAVFYPSEQSEMEMTRSHTVHIDNIELHASQGLVMSTMDEKRQNLRRSFLLSDQTDVFSVEVDMDITRSHTAAVDTNSDLISNGEMPSHPAKVDVDISKDKTILFSEDDEMERMRSHTVVIEYEGEMNLPRNQSAPVDGKVIKKLNGKLTKGVSFGLGENKPDSLDLKVANAIWASLEKVSNSEESHVQEHETLTAAVECEQTPLSPPFSIALQLSEKLIGEEMEITSSCGADEQSSGGTVKTSQLQNTVIEQKIEKQPSCVPVEKPVFSSAEGNDSCFMEFEQNEKDHAQCIETMQHVSKQGSPVSTVFEIGDPSIATIGNPCEDMKPRRRSIADIKAKVDGIKKKLLDAPESVLVLECHTAPVSRLVGSMAEVIECSSDGMNLEKDTLDRCNKMDALVTRKAISEPNSEESAKFQSKTKTPENQSKCITTPLNPTFRDNTKFKRMPFGVFPPKLPCKRNACLPNTSRLENHQSKAPSFHSDAHLDISSRLDALEDAGKLKVRPTSLCFINEELLPECVDEIDFNESLDCNIPKVQCEESNAKESFQNKINDEAENSEIEPNQKDTQKRQSQDYTEEELLKETKVMRSLDALDVASARQKVSAQVVWESRGRETMDENSSSALAKSIDGSSSSSSSLDSTKGEGTTIDLSAQRFNQFFINEESEQSLYEKLQAGTIRVQEFFKLLGVRLLIQRPRHSTLLACEDCNAAPSPEEQWLDRCIQRPKLQVYQEDCQALSQTIEELKLNMYDEDKFLVDVNKSLWEAIKSSSLSELKHWGGVLNTQKSYFTKKSKLLFHQRKVKLYSKLFESAQTQQEQLQKKMAADDQLLSEIDCCLASLEMETLNLDTCAVDDDLVAEQELELQVKERELEELSTRNKDFQSELVDLEKQKVECIGRKKELQTKTANCEEYLEEYRRLSDWKLQEWQESQAYFTFLYNSLELTVTFGETLDGVEFVDKPCKKIESVNFDSQLDDDIAPSYTLLVHRLVFQFIKQKGIWQETYPTQRHLPALLHDLSLVVSGCRLLGEEIHYLSRWGGKFNILKTDVHGNNVSFLFASVIAHSKFEITISLTPGYPDAPLQFMFRNHIGNLSQSHLSKVISDVQPGSSYLKRVVKSVHQKLLSMPP
ncbi:kinetochore scaffold 1 [Latimeria chalumnae]|uniref:kinetochore scaffold 1 n=1 Tax=Latimeria chalumnae TaxID=7897 RepID=UPI00313B76DD